MTDNTDLMETNEANKDSNGGTELTMRSLYDGGIDRDLLANFQIIPSRFRDVDETKIRIFAAHDLPEDTESNVFKDPKFRRSIHKYVYTSQWQYQRYQLVHGLQYDQSSVVIPSSIVPIELHVGNHRIASDPIQLIYTSTPQRGLDILVPVFEKLCEKHDDIHLKVFSSYKIYGWEDADKPFEPLYDRIRKNPKAEYLGFQPNNVVRDALICSDIFAYPCTWLETFCRAMVEAMSAECLCVHPNYGALPETSAGLNVMYQGDVDKSVHASVFYAHLDAAIEYVRQGLHLDGVKYNKAYVDSRYSKQRIVAMWKVLLEDLYRQYPTAESRKVKQEMFTVRT